MTETLAEWELAVEELRLLQRLGDEEVAHSKADAVLTGLLRSLGYGAVCDEWEKIDKWYA
jgi:hypothetical protein